MTAPAVPVAIALVVGVLTGVWGAWPIAAAHVVAVTVWALSVAVAARRVRPVWVAGALVAGFWAAGVLLGATRSHAATDTGLGRWFAEQPGAAAGRVGPVSLAGLLRADAAPTDYGAVVHVQVTQVGDPSRPQAVSGGIRLSVGGNLARARLSEWRAGRAVRVSATLRPPPSYRNPGQGDQARRGAMRGTVLLGSVKSALLVDVVRPGSAPAELASRVRAAVRRGVDQSVGRHGRRSAAIVTAVLIGDRSGLTALGDDTISRLQDGGTYHVIAISGGNIAILAGLLLLLGRGAGGRPRYVSTGVIAALVAYAYLVGQDASVGRATAAAVLVLAAGLIDHRVPPVNVIAVVALGVLVVSPLSLFDAGFILTFGATLGIVLGVSPLADGLLQAVAGWWDPTPRWVSSAVLLLAATLCAEAALMPVGAALFGRISVAGLFLNFLAIPLMTVTQVAGMVAVGVAETSASLSTLSPLSAFSALAAVSAAVGWVAHVAATLLVESTRLLDLFPWLAFRVPPPAWPTLVVYYAALLSLLWPRRPPAVRATGGWVLAAAVLWVVSAPWRPALVGPPAAGRLRITFLDVGQADATLVQTPDGASMLVDAGGTRSPRSDIGSRVVAPALWALGVRRLDVAALTHGDPDHAGGLGAVLRDFRPREVWDGVPVLNHPGLDALRAQAARLGTRWRQVARGERLQVGAVTVTVAHPPPADWDRVRVRNDDSVVLDLRYGGVSVLLPGDIGRAVEGEVAALLPPATFRIVKVPHHGSGGSSTPAFVGAAAPCLAIVSAGRANPFGHPAPEVVRRYQEAGALVLETARDGAITVETDGHDITVWTEAGRRLVYRSTQAGAFRRNAASGLSSISRCGG